MAALGYANKDREKEGFEYDVKARFKGTAKLDKESMLEIGFATVASNVVSTREKGLCCQVTRLLF